LIYATPRNFFHSFLLLLLLCWWIIQKKFDIK